MTLILAGIRSLAEHLRILQTNPEVYRPTHCPNCANRTVWHHGRYTRMADENGGTDSLNPVPIPRFRCPDCRKTCAVLPEVIPPRRRYLWAVQQAVLAVLWAGGSCYRASTEHRGYPTQQTIHRWWNRLTERFLLQAATLRPRLPELGRTTEFGAFWAAACDKHPLSALMTILHADGVAIP